MNVKSNAFFFFLHCSSIVTLPQSMHVSMTAEPEHSPTAVSNGIATEHEQHSSSTGALVNIHMC